MKNITWNTISGLTENHVVEAQPGIKIHKDVLPVWKSLCLKANKDNIQIKIASGHRTFKKQLEIWNQKCTGKRPVLDAEAKPLDIKKLSPEELIHAILRWSALPGMSRHHWGTDFDVYDESVTKGGYQLQLIPQEAEEKGPFHSFNHWLHENLHWFEFFRPYETDLGGVNPEWWHISFYPVAEDFTEAYSIQKLHELLKKSHIQLKDVLLPRLEEIHARYFLKINRVH